MRQRLLSQSQNVKRRVVVAVEDQSTTGAVVDALRQALAGAVAAARTGLPALPLPFAVPAWFPWRPFTVTRGVFTLGPLPVTAHAEVLRFSTNGPLAVTGETVHVPLNLAALRRIRAYTGPLMQRASHSVSSQRAILALSSAMGCPTT